MFREVLEGMQRLATPDSVAPRGPSFARWALLGAIVVAFGFGALGTAGCGDVKPDSASGEDFERAGAQELFLDKLTDDYLDAEEGDNTDWKFFKIRSRGILELTIYWDNKNVKSVIDVRDRFGVLIDSRRHSPELEKDRLDLKVEPGTHFVRLASEAGASVYTIEARFQSFDFKASDEATPEAIEDDPLADLTPPPSDVRPEVAPRPTGRRRPSGGGGGRVREPAPATGGLEARITRVLPLPSGQGSVIYLNKGTEDGIQQGWRGEILGLNAKQALEVREASPKFSKATTRATPGEIAHRRSVLIRP
jgi:hypothetical protein